MSAVDQVSGWPGTLRGVISCRKSDVGVDRVVVSGQTDEVLPWASITKLATALAVMVAIEEESISLDDEAGPGGATVRQLLSHAGGIAPSEARSLCPPATKRIYSNAGFELLAAHVEACTSIAFEEYLSDAVLEPLSMTRTQLHGSPASGVAGPVDDLAALLDELMSPTLITPESAHEMRTTQLPGLDGVLPGFGSFSPCPWGLGLEVKGTKRPHWTGERWGPGSVGHFGQQGGFLVIDDERRLGVVTLGNEPFGPWAITAWPQFLDDLHRELQSPAG